VFIVDTQVHIWKEETPDRPWIPGARERMRLNGHREEAFTYQECIDLMDEAGVDRVLIVPPSWEGDRIDYAMEACEATRAGSASWRAFRPGRSPGVRSPRRLSPR
jgi:predicted TIM-barrel fold metal-dependent hydrolase